MVTLQTSSSFSVYNIKTFFFLVLHLKKAFFVMYENWDTLLNIALFFLH